ncbi:TM2 domain-containing protein [Saccharothrix australiensis]|uniref:TM2 domain-containing protein n=1 Tax=Saccharothrix australiensis TaxID=2072 RepID=A0A495W7I9_9PSEU|nr:TM2 domain-containing protein [Saccharothrix australiensis]
MRIGNQQREAAISALNEHFAAGRLEIGEYEQRVGYATAAQTAAELAALFQDMPPPHPQFLPPPRTQYGSPTDYATPPPGYQQGYGGHAPGYGPGAGGYPPNHGGYPPGYGGYPPGYGPGVGPNAPFGVDPLTGQPLSDKSRVAAGVLQLVLPFGIGRFYIGDTALGVAQLLTCGGCGLWSLIDGIVLLVNGGTDSHGRKLRD